MNRFLFSILAITFFSIPMKAENIALKLKGRDLIINGHFTSSSGTPITISGYDLANDPYKFDLHSHVQNKGMVLMTYTLDRNGKMQSGSVLIEKGKVAKLATTTPKNHEDDLAFEAVISD